MNAPTYSSSIYSQYRPSYPSTLYNLIYSKLSCFNLCVDVGCGTGIVCKDLNLKFKTTVGVDPFIEMLDGLEIVPSFNHSQSGLVFMVGQAENLASLFPPDSADLVSCGTAAHWIDMTLFYPQAHLVLAPGGIFAIWGYGNLYHENSAVTALFDAFCHLDMKEYWDPRRIHLDNMYSEPQFLNPPGFKDFQRILFDDVENPCIMQFDWSLDQLAGYWKSWSPYKAFKEIHPNLPDPVDHRIAELRLLLNADRLNVKFPLVLLLGTKY